MFLLIGVSRKGSVQFLVGADDPEPKSIRLHACPTTLLDPTASPYRSIFRDFARGIFATAAPITSRGLVSDGSAVSGLEEA
jgi:hypothetical protein